MYSQDAALLANDSDASKLTGDQSFGGFRRSVALLKRQGPCPCSACAVGWTMGIPMPPPWVILSIALGFSKNLQNIKDVAGLGFSIVTGNGEEAGCSLCDKLVTIVLEQVELDDMSEGGGIDCPSICFGIGKCVDNCEKITGAMANSTGYPCVAAGLCPEVDEFGEVSCKWSYKKMGCEPATSCDRHFPNKCELKSSLKRWKRMNNLIGDNIGALGGALASRKKCSEAGADPNFCIREASGLGYIAEWACLLMVLVGGESRTHLHHSCVRTHLPHTPFATRSHFAHTTLVTHSHLSHTTFVTHTHLSHTPICGISHASFLCRRHLLGPRD